ncbi:hypothetical protein L1987_21142 [Smallanthus sonchifolius]|uniref:Uncharacterized protein n=1 Tax=Smallanthus sonchifolius TaxID=185202 RepID=A0ACB9IT39_9ASTR|nr:hypothetical protein L1987_21142 [Smallanthus sonchifolius]
MLLIPLPPRVGAFNKVYKKGLGCINAKKRNNYTSSHLCLFSQPLLSLFFLCFFASLSEEERGIRRDHNTPSSTPCKFPKIIKIPFQFEAMLVANNTFDLWQKDIFFSAAEEVQASADIMESAYRTWVRQKREGVKSVDLDELCRELQTALGTAKWQLDEFQRAVRLSYKNNINDVRTARHEQFVSAISSQISAVESALKDYFSDEIQKPLRWVNLDEEERDDLAMFLSGSVESSKSTKESNIDNPKFSYMTSCKDVNNHVVDVEPIEVLGTSDGSSCQADKKAGSRRTRVLQDVETLKITIDHDDEQKKLLMLNDVESTPKDKGYVWRPRSGNYWINQVFKRAAGSQRQLQTSIHLHRSCSFRLTLVLMLTIFLLDIEECVMLHDLADECHCFVDDFNNVIRNVLQLSMVLISKIKGNTRGLNEQDCQGVLSSEELDCRIS